MTTAVQSHPTGGGRRTAFCVSLIFLVKNKQLLERLRPDDGGFGEGAQVPGHGEVFRFLIETVEDEDDLGRRMATFRARERPSQFLVISDRLTVRRTDGGLAPSELAVRVREPFHQGPHLCGLIALVESVCGRVSEVDIALRADADRAELGAAIVKAATGLRLKAPPPDRDPAARPGIRVEAVQSMEQLRECLALRKQVYGLMSYLPEKIAADPSGLEMDGYDIGAIHFAAMRDGEVVGAARLVTDLPNNIGATSGIDFAAMDTFAKHRDWANRIARRSSPAVRARATCRPYFPLPILQSSDFNDRWADMLVQTSPGAELSRLVVAPAWRGYGISANLVRAVIAKAFQMHRRVLLLECIPAHVPMYSRYGFKPLSGDPHSRPTDLDQYAIAMWFKFHESARLATAAENLLAKIKMKLSPDFGPIDVSDGGAST